MGDDIIAKGGTRRMAARGGGTAAGLFATPCNMSLMKAAASAASIVKKLGGTKADVRKIAQRSVKLLAKTRGLSKKAAHAAACKCANKVAPHTGAAKKNK